MASKRYIVYLAKLFGLGYFVGVIITSVARFAHRPATKSPVSLRFLSDLNSHVDVDNTNNVSLQELEAFQSHKHAKQRGQDVLADLLYNKVRVMCWVMTNPKNIHVKTVHIKATWARRCNKVLYISSEDDPEIPTINVTHYEGRQSLWTKTRNTVQLIYDKYLDEADWFIKADDDSFLILENMRYFLAGYDPTRPLHFGFRFKPYAERGYMSGGASYVLSKAALKDMVEKVFPDEKLCPPYDFQTFEEDLEIGKCLVQAGVELGDTRDALGRDTFHPFAPEVHLEPGEYSEGSGMHWFVYYNTSRAKGPESCSDHTISFHYVTPSNLYLLEYLIYHMKPFGVGHYMCPSEATTILDKLLPA